MIGFLTRNHDADNDHAERQQVVGVEQSALNKHGRPCVGVFRSEIRTKIGNTGADYQDRGNKINGIILERLYFISSILSNSEKRILQPPIHNGYGRTSISLPIETAVFQ